MLFELYLKLKNIYNLKSKINQILSDDLNKEHTLNGIAILQIVIHNNNNKIISRTDNLDKLIGISCGTAFCASSEKLKEEEYY